MPPHFVDSVEQHEHAFGLLDDCSVVADVGDGGRDAILLFARGEVGVDVETVSTDDRTVLIAQFVTHDHYVV